MFVDVFMMSGSWIYTGRSMRVCHSGCAVVSVCGCGMLYGYVMSMIYVFHCLSFVVLSVGSGCNMAVCNMTIDDDCSYGLWIVVCWN